MSIVGEVAKKRQRPRSGTIICSQMEVMIDSIEATKTFGARLGELLRGGEVIELVGDVGAGKTTFAGGVAAGLDIEEDIQSPSFTISRVYEARDGLWLTHYDFYRLSEPGIMRDELQENTRDDKTVTMIEWADAVEEVLPEDHLRISIAPTSEHARVFTLAAYGPKSRKLVEQLT